MRQFSRRATLALFPALAAAGCQTVARPVPGGDAAPADLDFVANAQNIIEFDREECRLAMTQARSPAVRALAVKLLEDANAFDARLQPVLAQTGIKPPAALRSDLRVRLAHMRLQNGLDFDRSFVDDQIASHEEIINRQEMAPSGMSPAIAALAREGADILRRNLAELRRIRDQMRQ